MTTGAAKNEDLTVAKLFDVSKFVAVVTGGGTGIGLMITQALVANGGKVYITGRRQETLDSVVQQYSPGSDKIIGIAGDVTSKDEVQGLARRIGEQEPDGIHLLVNNAGVALEDDTKYSNSEPDFKDARSVSEHMWKSDPTSWRETFDTNVGAVYFVSAAFLPLLALGRACSPGYSPSIVNITSISGVMKTSSSGQFAYAASKAAAIHLTRMLAFTFADAKIRVNGIAPGVFPSEMTAGSSNEAQKSEISQESSNSAGRPGHDADMAACILYLASPGAVFLNGHTIYLDGGSTLLKPAAI